MFAVFCPVGGCNLFPLSKSAVLDYGFSLSEEKILNVCTFYCISRSPDEIIQYIEEHTAQISSMKGTRYVKPFENEIVYWEKSITQISELCDGLLNVQRQWLYMEGIFNSDDVQRQLSRETSEFKYINKIWQDEILGKIRENPNALYIATKLSL
jgi:hypothetical protein